MPNLNVLVVEDDDAIRRLLVECLKTDAAVTVDSARDGVEALHQMATTTPQVIVLDVMMPKMSGIDLLESLKAMCFDPSVKSIDEPPAVLIVTGAPDNVVGRNTIEERFPKLVHGVYRKPVDVRRLADAVRSISASMSSSARRS